MEEMQERIERIESKLKLLLKEYADAQKEIQRLQKENRRLSDQLQTHESQSHEFCQKSDLSKFSGRNLKGDPKKDLEKRIDTYLKDIEKCLALLNS